METGGETAAMGSYMDGSIINADTDGKPRMIHEDT